MTKRLFIFAGYYKFQSVDYTLLYYLNSLSALGDIVFNMDNDLPDNELAKITAIPNMLSAAAHRHGEYDFGSYKRGYVWARDNKILDKYDWVYLVNDSVFGPFVPLEPLIEKMENSGADFTGMLRQIFTHLDNTIHSWFAGLSKSIVNSDFFNDFICNVHNYSNKYDVIVRCELRLNHLITARGYKTFAVFDNTVDNWVYCNPVKLLEYDFPFLKKSALFHISDFWQLYAFADESTMDMVRAYTDKYELFLNPTVKYARIYQFAPFGLPVFSIYKRGHSYKYYLFDVIPFCRVIKK